MEKHRKKTGKKWKKHWTIGDVCFSKNESNSLTITHVDVKITSSLFWKNKWKLILLTSLTPSQRRIWVGQYNLPGIYKLITTRKTKIQRFLSVQLRFRQPGNLNNNHLGAWKNLFFFAWNPSTKRFPWYLFDQASVEKYVESCGFMYFLKYQGFFSWKNIFEVSQNLPLELSWGPWKMRRLLFQP